MRASQSGDPRSSQSLLHMIFACASLRPCGSAQPVAPSCQLRHRTVHRREMDPGLWSRQGSAATSGQPFDPHAAWIREQVRARPGITVRELANRVNERIGLSVCRDAVWRFLNRCGIGFKKMTPPADGREWSDVRRWRSAGYAVRAGSIRSASSSWARPAL